MIIWESGNIARCQICGVCSNPYPSRSEQTDKTAVTYRLACGHLLDPFPNQALDHDGKKPPQVSYIVSKEETA